MPPAKTWVTTEVRRTRNESFIFVAMDGETPAMGGRARRERRLIVHISPLVFGSRADRGTRVRMIAVREN
jgi:hypothetical protein